ncbi:putative membrane protein YcfT [Prosthecomicrobium pneumaticum]|uniref:Putative membrane protein YcfT n=2 Tax=Prosthecomicrobium pneumaticum TaxID=81895 RepID=A0A7W9L3T3_9HYPH|nr:putative membrane protein YcfT [Prosthecomicrobium pneumaticum]
MPRGTGTGRVDWVDIAKGFCIVMVVVMHSTLGVEKAAGAQGWMTHVVAFAKPFRMPDFFMISGLFLARVIDRPWRDHLDRKVLHFAYFYVLWLTIQFAFKAPGMAAEGGAEAAFQAYLLAFIDPFGTLWFIYLLPIFFVVAKVLRGVPGPLVLAAAAALQVARIDTGWMVPDEFAARFVYFYAGYALAPAIFRLADAAARHRAAALGGLIAWGIANGAAVATGVSEVPGLGLLLGFLGAGAVVTGAALAAPLRAAGWLRALGSRSIVVYLAFFLPMAIARVVLLKLGLFDLGTTSLVVSATAVAMPVALARLVRDTPARFLFERPAFLRLRPRPDGGLAERPSPAGGR